MIIHVPATSRSWGLSVWGSSNTPDYIGSANTARDKLGADPQFRANQNLHQSPAVFFKGYKVTKAINIQGKEMTHPKEIRENLEWIRSVEVANA
jgi:hypothetical protein